MEFDKDKKLNESEIFLNQLKEWPDPILQSRCTGIYAESVNELHRAFIDQVTGNNVTGTIYGPCTTVSACFRMLHFMCNAAKNCKDPEVIAHIKQCMDDLSIAILKSGYAVTAVN